MYSVDQSVGAVSEAYLEVRDGHSLEETAAAFTVGQCRLTDISLTPR